MRVIRLLVLALVLLLPVAQAPHGLAQEATPGASLTAGGSPVAGWPQFRANPEHTGTALGPGPGDAPVVRWRVENGGGLASPAVADGVVYAGGNGNYVFALDAQRIGVTPAIAAGLVYIATDQVYGGGDAPSAVIAVDAATGAERWRHETGVEGDTFFSSPTIVDGELYIGSQSEVGPSALHALDAATGEGIWRWDVSQYMTVFSSPAVVDGTVYVGGDGLYAVDAATGAPKWRLGIGDVWSSPAVVYGVV